MKTPLQSARLKTVVVGVRVHSGWGAVVTVSGGREGIEVVDRRRVAIIDPEMPGAFQPYHFSQNLKLNEAEKHLRKCAAASQLLARESVRAMLAELRGRGFDVSRAAILLASGRALPALPEILASHPLLHTAEGEFFRRSFWKAWEDLDVPVTGIRERDLDERVQASFGRSAPRLRGQIATAGKLLGPPWTTDQKSAALSAAILLVLANPKY